jgi:glycosyltransferase involved in cell wall biosynthesis
VRAAAGEADLLHLHHLTPANEAAIRCFPSLPIVGHLHGTELAFLRTVEAGPPAGWRYAARWAERLRGWAQRCELVLVPPGAEAEAALLLGLERGRLRSLPGGVDLARFAPQPLAPRDRFAFWRRWLVDEPRGWDRSGRPGSVAYDEQDLAPFHTGAPVLLYVGRFTAVKRLPLLIAAHARANKRLQKPGEAGRNLARARPRDWVAADARAAPSGHHSGDQSPSAGHRHLSGTLICAGVANGMDTGFAGRRGGTAAGGGHWCPRAGFAPPNERPEGWGRGEVVMRGRPVQSRL